MQAKLGRKHAEGSIFQNPPSFLSAFFITWLYTGPYPTEGLVDNWFVDVRFQMSHTEKQTHTPTTTSSNQTHINKDSKLRGQMKLHL